MQTINFFDENGLLHHVPNPTNDSSEIELLFTGEYIVLKTLLNKVTDEEINKFFNMLDFLAKEIKEGKRVSHDNMTGIYCACKSLMHYCPQSMENVMRHLPAIEKHRLHPRDLIFYNYAKGGLLGWLLLPLVSLMMIISCARIYKVRNGNKIIATDSKLLTFIRCTAFELDWTFKICTWFISKNKFLKSWTGTALYYFKEEGQPIPKLMGEW